MLECRRAAHLGKGREQIGDSGAKRECNSHDFA